MDVRPQRTSKLTVRFGEKPPSPAKDVLNDEALHHQVDVKNGVPNQALLYETPLQPVLHVFRATQIVGIAITFVLASAQGAANL